MRRITRRIVLAVLLSALAVPCASAQGPQTLRIETEVPRLPSDLMYAAARVKPPRLRAGTNAPVRIDDADFFVQQHYVDFLSRFPDESGLDFWTRDITQCGADARCVEIKRINVSAAFFLSIEFQETGYLVYRVHKSAYGNLAGAPVPVRREDFMPDTRRIGEGVVVGQGDWQQRLEENKRAYALHFVARPAFAAAFPPGLAAEEFVDRLDRNAGGVLSPAERAQLVAELQPDPADAARRARVLRLVAENAELGRREFNRAFVLMQYFGYLKRNPDAAPDASFDGYLFWLDKLNQFGGNFIQAEMVKAFISSIEYRARFEP